METSASPPNRPRGEDLRTKILECIEKHEDTGKNTFLESEQIAGALGTEQRDVAGSSIAPSAASVFSGTAFGVCSSPPISTGISFRVSGGSGLSPAASACASSAPKPNGVSRAERPPSMVFTS